ncbi:MAG: DNA-deoxyinosine glycosylase [Acutalibacteraceae bacterium]
MIEHPIPPLFDEHSKTLILGSFPSVKSREVAFFYGHRQNRFWRVLAALYKQPTPQTTEEKKKLILENQLALWDVVASCDVQGSADSSLKNVKPNDLGIILQTAKIERIFTNGKTAFNLYNKFLLKETGIEAVCLPSTSPANAKMQMPELLIHWKVIADEL